MTAVNSGRDVSFLFDFSSIIIPAQSGQTPIRRSKSDMGACSAAMLSDSLKVEKLDLMIYNVFWFFDLQSQENINIWSVL